MGPYGNLKKKRLGTVLNVGYRRAGGNVISREKRDTKQPGLGRVENCEEKKGAFLEFLGCSLRPSNAHGRKNYLGLPVEEECQNFGLQERTLGLWKGGGWVRWRKFTFPSRWGPPER